MNVIVDAPSRRPKPEPEEPEPEEPKPEEPEPDASIPATPSAMGL